jgi:uncharacterized protein (DUF433 family)
MPLQGSDIAFCEIPPQGMMASRPVGFVYAFGEPEGGRNDLDWWMPHDARFLVSHRLKWLDARQRYMGLWERAQEEELRAYTIPIVDAFRNAARFYSHVSIDPNVMAGAPCIEGTRIPVYMVLDAIEYYGSIEGAIKSYPSLTVSQVIEALGFSKLVVECPFEDKFTPPAR